MFEMYKFTRTCEGEVISRQPQPCALLTALLCLQKGPSDVGCSTSGALSNRSISQPCTNHMLSTPLSEQLAPASAIASTDTDPAADVHATKPSTVAESGALDLDHIQTDAGLKQTTASQAGAVAAAAANADAATEESIRRCAAPRHHADCPAWLPEQLGQLQQQYAAAGPRAGLAGDSLLGQRVAFALLEDFHQHDSRREVDTLLAGLHTGQYASCHVHASCQACACVTQAVNVLVWRWSLFSFIFVCSCPPNTTKEHGHLSSS